MNKYFCPLPPGVNGDDLHDKLFQVGLPIPQGQPRLAVCVEADGRLSVCTTRELTAKELDKLNHFVANPRAT